jgi:hypothetical protein
MKECTNPKLTSKAYITDNEIQLTLEILYLYTVLKNLYCFVVKRADI